MNLISLIGIQNLGNACCDLRHLELRSAAKNLVEGSLRMATTIGVGMGVAAFVVTAGKEALDTMRAYRNSLPGAAGMREASYWRGSSALSDKNAFCTSLVSSTAIKVQECIEALYNHPSDFVFKSIKHSTGDLIYTMNRYCANAQGEPTAECLPSFDPVPCETPKTQCLRELLSPEKAQVLERLIGHWE